MRMIIHTTSRSSSGYMERPCDSNRVVGIGMQQIHQFSLLVHDLDIAEVKAGPIVLVVVGGVSRFQDLILGNWYAVRHGDVEAVDMLWRGKIRVRREDVRLLWLFDI